MTLKIKQKPQSPKIYRAPKHLSIEALGLLAHTREHKNSDGNYSWGVLKTAEYFGRDHRKIRKAYQELIRKHQVEPVQSGKDPKTGKSLLLIVRPLGKNPWAPVMEPMGKNPVAMVPLEISPLEPSSGISAPHSVSSVPTDISPVSIDGVSPKTVVVRSTNAIGLRARLDEERSELALWENKPKYAVNATACRQRIADLEAQLMESEQSASTTGDSNREAGSCEQ
jgi:hypothetical protein